MTFGVYRKLESLKLHKLKFYKLTSEMQHSHTEVRVYYEQELFRETLKLFIRCLNFNIFIQRSDVWSVPLVRIVEVL